MRFYILTSSLMLLAACSGGGSSGGSSTVFDEQMKSRITAVVSDIAVVERSVAIASGQTRNASVDPISAKASKFASKLKATCGINIPADKAQKLKQSTYQIAEMVNSQTFICPVGYLKSYFRTENTNDDGTGSVETGMKVELSTDTEAIANEISIRSAKLEGSILISRARNPANPSDMIPSITSNLEGKIDSLREGMIDIRVETFSSGTRDTGFLLRQVIVASGGGAVVRFMQETRGQGGTSSYEYSINGNMFSQKDFTNFMQPEIFYFPPGPQFAGLFGNKIQNLFGLN